MFVLLYFLKQVMWCIALIVIVANFSQYYFTTLCWHAFEVGEIFGDQLVAHFHVDV